MKNGFKKFKKADYEMNYPFVEKIIIRIDTQENLEKFKKDVIDDMSKKDFRVFDKIKLMGLEATQQCIIKCKKEKFKNFKQLVKDADMKKLDHIDIIMVDGISQELDDDDAVLIAKMVKRIAKKYNALVKCKSI